MSDIEPDRDAGQRLRDRRVLIVEDEYFIANDLARAFSKAGVEIAGPVPTLDQAVALLEGQRIDMAVLDINLDGERVYPVADALIERNVPIVFVTGYDRNDIPARYAGVTLCQKPVGTDEVIAALARVVAE